jgi:hypothetical protein
MSLIVTFHQYEALQRDGESRRQRGTTLLQVHLETYTWKLTHDKGGVLLMTSVISWESPSSFTVIPSLHCSLIELSLLLLPELSKGFVSLKFPILNYFLFKIPIVAPTHREYPMFLKLEYMYQPLRSPEYENHKNHFLRYFFYSIVSTLRILFSQ